MAFFFIKFNKTMIFYILLKINYRIYTKHFMHLKIQISGTQVRSPKGSQCTTVAAASKGANIHVISFRSNIGFIYGEI